MITFISCEIKNFNNLWQSLLEERRKKLRATETKVTLCDGSVFVENRNESGERVLTKQETKSSGFVVDTKPDLQVIYLKLVDVGL